MRLIAATLITLAALPVLAAGPATETLPSGVTIEWSRDGSGTPPGPTDKVRVHYKGTLADGKEFDSSYSRGTPTEFPLNRVIPCWTEALQRMKPGSAARITCPAETAYGDRGIPGVIPPNSTLTFAVELLEVKR